MASEEELSALLDGGHGQCGLRSLSGKLTSACMRVCGAP